MEKYDKKFSRSLFVSKNYKEYIIYIEPLFDSIESEFDKRNALNNLVISYSKVIIELNDKSIINYEYIKKYLNSYLGFGKNETKEKLKEWSPNITEALISDVIKVIINMFESNFNQLKEEIINLLRDFESIFEEVFPDLVLNQFLMEIYKERQNFDKNYRNISITKIMCEIFIELTQNSRKKSEVYSILSDLAYFYPENEKDKENKEKTAINYIELSLKEFSDNKFAQDRKKELIKIIETNQQISRFIHDSGSKIGYMRDIIKEIVKKNNDVNILKIDKYIDEIQGIFNLVKDSKANYNDIDIDIFLNDFKNGIDNAEITITVTGNKKIIELDKNYLLIILTNLVKNSIDAYERNNIQNKKTIDMIFDYDKFEFQISDKAGGVPKEFRENNKLFEPYVSSKGIMQNCGLGLTNVKRAVEKQKGIIEYKTNDEGTTFIVKFNLGDE